MCGRVDAPPESPFKRKPAIVTSQPLSPWVAPAKGTWFWSHLPNVGLLNGQALLQSCRWSGQGFVRFSSQSEAPAVQSCFQPLVSQPLPPSSQVNLTHSISASASGKTQLTHSVSLKVTAMPPFCAHPKCKPAIGLTHF